MRGKQLLGALAALLLNASPTLAMPDTEFACQVQTLNVRLGVVFVQAESAEVAAALAPAKPAITVDGGKAGVQSVLTCIRFPGQVFPDKQFHAFVSKLPR